MNICSHCDRKFASQQSLCNHRHKCPEMKTARGRGRPTNAELERRNLLSSSSYSSSSSSSSSPLGKRSLSPETVVIDEPVQKKRVAVVSSKKVPELWADTYEKALLMLNEGADEKVIKLALSWDKCFKENPSNLKESLENYYDFISKDLQDDKKTINEDYIERGEEDKDYLRPFLNADSSKSVEELHEHKSKLEKELLYVNYAINLKAIFPQLKMLKLMISLVPKEKKREVDVMATESQSLDYIDEGIFKSDEEVKEVKADEGAEAYNVDEEE